MKKNPSLIFSLMALVILFPLTGCSSFRNDVQAVSVSGTGTYDPTNGAVGGAVTTTLTLRDPKGLVK